MNSLIAWAAWLEATALGEQMRSSALLYPALNLLHLLGLVLLLGPMLLLDARLLGAGRSFPLTAVSRTLTPLAVAGLLLLLGSGVCLFAADAGPLAVDRLLQLELLLIALGIPAMECPAGRLGYVRATVRSAESGAVAAVVAPGDEPRPPAGLLLAQRALP